MNSHATLAEADHKRVVRQIDDLIQDHPDSETDAGPYARHNTWGDSAAGVAVGILRPRIEKVNPDISHSITVEGPSRRLRRAMAALSLGTHSNFATIYLQLATPRFIRQQTTQRPGGTWRPYGIYRGGRDLYTVLDAPTMQTIIETGGFNKPATTGQRLARRALHYARRWLTGDGPPT